MVKLSRQDMLLFFSPSCVMFYVDKQEHYDPFVLQLTRSNVEDVDTKSHEHCIKLSNGENQVYLSFSNAVDHNNWLTRCSKVECTLYYY